jgi:hypothetical protein
MVMRSPVHSGCLEQLAGGDRDGDRVRLATLEMDRSGEGAERRRCAIDVAL